MVSIYRVATDLFLQLYSSCRLALRLVGVKASELVQARSLPLFEPYAERLEKLGQALDRVREKYGFGAILTARERMLEAIYPLEKDRGFVLKTASLTR
jgi:DNA polymerase-4